MLARGALQVVLGNPDRAVLVDVPGHLGPNVGVGDRAGPGRKEPGIRERRHPHLPVLAAHRRHGVGDFLVVWRDSIVTVLTIPLSVSTVLFEKVLAHGLEHRLVDGAGLRVDPPRRREGVDDQVHLPQVGLDRLQGLRLDVVRKRVAVDVLRVEAGRMSRLREPDRIVPSRRRGAPLLRGASRRKSRAWPRARPRKPPSLREASP